MTASLLAFADPYDREGAGDRPRFTRADLLLAGNPFSYPGNLASCGSLSDSVVDEIAGVLRRR